MTKRVLLVASTRIGDAILSTGLLRHLVETRPDVRFTVACGAPAAPIFGCVPGLERIIIIEKKKMAGHWLTLWRKTVTTWWDLVIDLRRSALGYVLPARRRVVALSDLGRHRVVENAAVLGLVDPPAPKIWTGPSHRDKAMDLIPDIDTAPVLAIGPTANWRGKQWRAERFAELIARLTGPGCVFAGARVALFGGPSERLAAKPVIDAVPEAQRIDLIGRVDLLTASACLARCAMYIGNDSGLMHLAAASGTPTVGLFGPSRPEHYAPWGDHCAVVRTTLAYDELVGGPGYDHKTTDTLMDSLSVDAVQITVNDLYQTCQGATT